jgi:hypothetical protein
MSLARKRTQSSKLRRGAVATRQSAAPALDLIKTRADWQTAVADYGVISRGYVALCRQMESAARATAAEHSKRLAAVYDEEAKLAGAMDKQDEAASAILAAPVSIEALQAKLSLFQHHIAREQGVDQQLDGGSIDDVAVGIVLDLLTLIRRGEGLAQIAKAA